MALEESAHNLYDLRLRPRLLQWIMATYLPDDSNHPPKSISDLSLAVSYIRKHKLLSESLNITASKSPGKHLVGRRGIVDAWVDRILLLVSNHVAEIRWAGINLVGVTSQECIQRRFIDSYALWLQKLVQLLKLTEPAFIRASACASLADIFTRLGGLSEFPGLRRDAASLAGKLVHPLIQILSDKESSIIWNDAIDLLCAILKSFPASLRQQYNIVEGLLFTQLMDVECNSIILQKYALAIALLPRAHGDASAWVSIIRRILTTINTELNGPFVDMEKIKASEILLPVKQDSPWSTTGTLIPSSTSAKEVKRCWEQLVPRVSALVQCCQFLLVKPYPVPVHVPLNLILALVRRILHVDGSRLTPLSPLGVNTSINQQIALCLELPCLHECAIDLLHATVCGARSQILPQAVDVVQLLTFCFRRTGLTSIKLRIKVYNLVRQLLVAMGAGMAEALAPIIVGNALPDLKVRHQAGKQLSPEGVRTSSTNNPSSLTGMLGGDARNLRKRKEAGGLPVDQAIDEAYGRGDIDEVARPVPLQVAALQSLEALLIAGGSLLPERVRTEVDTLLANVAISLSTERVCGSITCDEEISSVGGIINISSSSLQVAAYRALLASFLSPCSHRPPFLAQGLALFQRGRKEVGTEVAEVCAHAILALEPLIHPRCLPSTNTAAEIMPSLASSKCMPLGIVNPSLQKLGKPRPGAGAVGTTIPAISSGPSFHSNLTPPAKVSHFASDPWAEVDTWLGYGEDLSEDWAGLFVDDINNDELLENFGVANAQPKVGLYENSGGVGDGNSGGDINTLPATYAQVVTRMNDETMSLNGEGQMGGLLGTQSLDAAPELERSVQFRASQSAVPDSIMHVPFVKGLTNQAGGSGAQNISNEHAQVMTESRNITDSSKNEGPTAIESVSLMQNFTAEAMDDNPDLGNARTQPMQGPLLSIELKTASTQFLVNEDKRKRVGSDSDSDFIPEIVDGDPESDYSH